MSLIYVQHWGLFYSRKDSVAVFDLLPLNSWYSSYRHFGNNQPADWRKKSTSQTSVQSMDTCTADSQWECGQTTSSAMVTSRLWPLIVHCNLCKRVTHKWNRHPSRFGEIVSEPGHGLSLRILCLSLFGSISGECPAVVSQHGSGLFSPVYFFVHCCDILMTTLTIIIPNHTTNVRKEIQMGRKQIFRDTLQPSFWYYTSMSTTCYL